MSGHSTIGGAHPNASLGGTTNSVKGGPQPAGSHTLKTEFQAHASRVQLHLHSMAHWHQHWHHPWVWGAYAYLPTTTAAGMVVGVPSGNTLSVTNGAGLAQPVRLFGVAAPVPGQAFFSESQENLSSLANQKYVRVFQTGVDPSGAMVGQVFLSESGIDLSEKQLRDGMAWNFVDDGLSPNLVGAEEAAQTTRTGLWSEEYPVAPWIYAE
jgi:endonuclease YncB( thermonuclease family)